MIKNTVIAYVMNSLKGNIKPISVLIKINSLLNKEEARN